MQTHEAFLRLPEVRKSVPYSKASLYRLIARGEFPAPYSLGARAVAWLKSDVDQWIESRIGKQPRSTHLQAFIAATPAIQKARKTKATCDPAEESK